MNHVSILTKKAELIVQDMAESLDHQISR